MSAIRESSHTMQYSAVIFDLFGTLVNEAPIQELDRLQAEMAAALSVPHEDFVRLWAETSYERGTGAFATIEANLEHICRVLGVTTDAASIAAAASLRLGVWKRARTPRPDVVETLARLRMADFKIGVISNCSPDIERLWQDNPCSPLVDVVILSSSVGLLKPDPRIYRLACERLEMQPHGCLYISDGSSGELTGAAEVGMHPVRILVPYEDSDAYLPKQEWRGPTISAIKEALPLLDLGHEGLLQ